MSLTATIDSKKPTTKQELIATNIKLLIEQLNAGKSEVLTNYLTAMSRFHNYSFGNVLEIARQMPTATRVAGFWTWKNLGRSVNVGAKDVRILAPIVGVKRKKDEEAEKDITMQNTRALLGFRNAYVFDVSQTSGVDLPEMHQVSGNPGENIERLAAFLKAQDIMLVYTEKIAPALGCSYGGRIALFPGQTKAEEFSTLVHETAHEMLHKAERRTATTKTVRETEAEAVAFVVGKAVGLVTGNASADYIQLTTATLPCSPRVWKSFSRPPTSSLPLWSRRFPSRKRRPARHNSRRRRNGYRSPHSPSRWRLESRPPPSH